MKAQIKQSELSRVAAAIAALADKRGGAGSLVALDCDGESVSVFGGMDAYYSRRIRTSGECSPGRVAVPAPDFAKYVALLPGGDVAISLDAKTGKVKLSAGGACFCLDAVDADPETPDLGDALAGVIELPAEDLHEMLRSTIGFASVDDTRQTLKGIFLNIKNLTLYAVATDGRAAACHLHECATDCGEAEAILPTSAAKRLISLLSNLEGTVTLRFCERGIQVFATGWLFGARGIDTKYPAWRRVFPDGYDASFSICTDVISLSLKRAAAVGGYVKLRANNSNLEICAGSALGHSHFEESAAVKMSSETKFSGTFDAILLASVISAAPAPGLKVLYSKKKFQPIVVSTSEWQVVVMPMREG